MKEWIFFQTLAFFCGFVLDCFLGDPHSMPHLVVFLGSFISFLEGKLRLGEENPKDFFRGMLLTAGTCLMAVLFSLGIVTVAWRIHPGCYWAVETLLCWQVLAPRQLVKESRKVEKALESGDVEQAREAVSMIVGRDTDVLDEDGIIRAAVETVAENTSDGVIAPMFYLFLGGAVGGCFYKAVNTLDSMVGYKNQKYFYFGRASARTDDFVNWLPARISALLMLCACFFLSLRDSDTYSLRRGVRIFRRDRYRHASPNSAQTESVCAGALGIRLAGDAVYGGVLYRKEYIGDAVRPIACEDITRAGRLMYGAAIFALLLIILIRMGWYQCF